jgi:hypothetical protein
MEKTKKTKKFSVQIRQSNANQWSMPARFDSVDSAIEEASILFKQFIDTNNFIDIRITKLL